MNKLFITILACLVATTMMAQNYATYYNGKYDMSLPPGSGLAAYIVTGVKNGKLTYQKIADAGSNYNTVSAGTAILLCLSSENTGDVNPNFTTNLLHGSDTETTTTGGAIYYKLTFSNNNDNFGWYWGAAKGGAFTSPANKAWLALPAAPASARVFLGLPDDETSGISPIENKQRKADNLWYDLNGRRVNAPMTKGIYVKDGRKMVIK